MTLHSWSVKLLSTFIDHYQKMPLCYKKCGNIYTHWPNHNVRHCVKMFLLIIFLAFSGTMHSRVFWIQSKFKIPIKRSSRIHKRDSDVSNPLYGGQALMVVSEASRVHERPALPGSFNGAVVPQEPTAAALNTKSLIVNTMCSCSIKLLQNSRNKS